jgi:PhnB protein
MDIQPYVFLEGRCDEAIAFYRQALGAEVKMLMRYKESPEKGMIRPGMEERVMHAHLRIGQGDLLLSDGMCAGKPSFQGFSLTLTVKDEAESRRVFEALADGGKVQMPLTKTFYSPSFGMLTDRFGVGWMVIVPGTP